MNPLDADSLSPLILGAAVLIATRLVYGGHRTTARDMGHLFLSIGGWGLVALGLLATFQVGLGTTLGLLFWMALLVIAAMTASRRRSAERNALLWVLAIAAEKLMPLDRAVEAFADEWGGRFGQRTRRLAELLRMGLSLPDALDLQRHLLTDDGVVAARVGTESGSLGRGLREAAAASSQQEPLWQALISRLFYLYLVFYLTQIVIVFLMVRISPAMRNIFDDFDVELPAVTEAVVGISKIAGDLFWILFAPLLIIQIVIPLYGLLYYMGWVPARVPILERIVERLHTAVILRSLAVFAVQQRPLPQAVASLARSYPRGWIRRRLVLAERDLAQGANWCDSFEDRRLIRPADAAVLRSAQRAGNLPWALREVAESGERRLAYRLSALMQIAFLVVLVMLASMATTFVLAFFLPLVELIGRIS